MLLCCLCGSVYSLGDYERFRFIDRKNNNFLFRGNNIVSNGQLQYDWLVQGIKETAKSANISDFPDSFFLIDFCLLEVEYSDWSTEEAFFAQNSTLGQFVHNPIIGALEDPMWFPESLRQVLALNVSGFDDLPGTVSLLSKLLSTPYPQPTVIYVHCEAGKDRTGEVSGAYYISQLGLSFNEALYYDNKCVEGSRDIEMFSGWAFEWYCWYLKYGFENFKSLDCVPDPSFDGHCF
uniref:Tyrosine specific protein phosphatases domain-containing protein n=1 Tax=Arcella intermedia TaxID=1963864 RepID=A0A6B2LGU6_9EUKA